ncbi:MULTISPECIES: cyclic pyranopterin monophosphate synthase MoaC [unclassified Dehalobacter]|uniref:cyclic pyranopterin monophosphate synthase MoaC n=1 Tax=unclassified Dehalobacter TaxID=2635733 RepID=UPI000E6C4BCC|nr:MULTISPECIES: cyclic pyranopterin monophosphate synthase MoaC [unclassified Dehalobacter]RJE48854.1 molybdenum cofactor biosynthesis protein C [Dehalobacter sp. MCB1]TCX52016.1 cyclic pyranopterin monophosphate synthase MoaC [Dehalobacter sp. 14DCB1]TCX53090.1 cyclic pyranopterin monophosphate synthase MoaC [Dehalobacter sp. 12DCB1]
MSELTHFNEEGRARMVNVSGKAETTRVAVARGEIRMKPETLALVKEGLIAKGDVLAVSQVAGIMGAKKTSDIIPMCHPLLLSGIDVSFKINEQESKIEIQVTVNNSGQTGVEMEALTGVSVAALTIYDMCKAAEKDMVIGDICLVSKSGGKSGNYIRADKTKK